MLRQLEDIIASTQAGLTEAYNELKAADFDAERAVAAIFAKRDQATKAGSSGFTTRSVFAQTSATPGRQAKKTASKRLFPTPSAPKASADVSTKGHVTVAEMKKAVAAAQEQKVAFFNETQNATFLNIQSDEEFNSPPSRWLIITEMIDSGFDLKKSFEGVIKYVNTWKPVSEISTIYDILVSKSFF